MKKTTLLALIFSLMAAITYGQTNVVPYYYNDPIDAQNPGVPRGLKQSRYGNRAFIAHPPAAGGYYWYRPYKGSYYYPRYLYYPFYNDYQYVELPEEQR